MSEFWYVASTGRCGTQYLARLMHQIRKGNRFVSFDWHAFSWVDYFADRFGPAFRFLHLVRNPYDAAASHATHTPMDLSLNLPHEAACRIFASDPGVAHPHFAPMADAFNIYERHLFHWLEVTQFLLDQSGDESFRGLYRFEDVMAPDRKALTDLVSRIMGRTTDVPKAAPFDRVHRASPWPLSFEVAPALRAAVDGVARRVGYDQAELDAACDPRRLRSTYSARRFDLPCDPSMPVIGR